MGIIPLAEDFPDEDLKVGKRIVQVNLTELDELRVVIKMAGGLLGEITVKASTLSQIIQDRNKANSPVEIEEGATVINVGDGFGEPVVENKVAEPDELLRKTNWRVELNKTLDQRKLGKT